MSTSVKLNACLPCIYQKVSKISVGIFLFFLNIYKGMSNLAELV